MSPDPDQTPDPEEIPYFFDTWCSLPWTEWVPFSATKEEFKKIPGEPGLYRIRPAGKDFLMYIGETRRSLHTRLQDLRMELRKKDLMPWSDPHTEAPGLWCWSDWSSDQEEEKNPQDSTKSERLSNLEEEKSSSELFEHYTYECSATPLDASTGGRRGMEAFLLSRYRQERGESPLCNFGRFHPRYRKSTNRKEGLRGGKLAEEHKDNPAGWPGIAPLEATGKPGDRDWMDLEWTAWEPLSSEKVQSVAAGAGLYLLADAGSNEIVYIGQSADVAKRLLDHSRKTWDDKTLQFSYQIIGQAVLPHNLRELGNDLIGNFFRQYRKAPEHQFSSLDTRF